MDRSFRQTVRFIITSLIGAIALSVITTPTSAQAAALTSTRSVTATTAGQVPQWVLTADQYVRVTNGVARVSPAIYSRLDRATVQQVMQAVAQFNALDREYRLGPVHINITSPYQKPVMLASCQGQERITITYTWWGMQYWLNSCAVLSIAAAGNNAAIIAGVIAAICPKCALVAGVMGGVLAIYANWITWADQYCGGQGVYVNRPWSGPMWVSRVC